MEKKQLVFNFGRKGKANFIQEANRRSVLKGTVGSFGKWCRSQGLDVDGKVTLKCIKRAKSSGNVKLIKRATYAKNIGGYLGARHKRSSRFGRPRFVKSIPKNRVARSVMQPVNGITFKNKRVSKYNFNFSPEEMDYINNRRNFLEREIKFLETVNLMTLRKTLHVLKTTTPKEVLKNNVRTRIDIKLYTAIIDHLLDIEEGEEASSYESPGDNKLFTLRVKKIAKRTSRFGNIMDPASYYHLIGEYNDELRTNNKYTRGRYQARYRYYQNMLNETFSQRVIPINYLVQSLDALNVNTTTNKIKRYVIIRRILKIIRENMHDQEATRIANRTREPLPRNLRNFRNSFGNTDDYVDPDSFVYLEREKQRVLPRIQQELDLAQKVVDSYPEDDILKKRAKGSIDSISKRLRKALTIKSITEFITLISLLFAALAALFYNISQMHGAYHNLRADSKTFRKLSDSTSERAVKAYTKNYKDNERVFQDFAHRSADMYDIKEVTDAGTQFP